MTSIDPAHAAALEARFAVAARHSRLVRLLRVAVPVGVAMSLGAIVLVSIFNPFRIVTSAPVDVGNVVVSGTKITMEAPHLSGFSPDGRPYELWAKTATQDVTDPDKVELATLRAKMMTEDRATVTMDAKTGLFDNKTQLLDLHKDIFLQTSTGYEARLTRALVDIGKGVVTSNEPVDVKLLNGTLTADGLKITDGGEYIRFEGNVRMNLKMESPTPTESVAPPTDREPSDEAADPAPAPVQKARHGKRANAK